MEGDTISPNTFTKYGHFVWIATKTRNVILDPLQCQNLNATNELLVHD